MNLIGRNKPLNFESRICLLASELTSEAEGYKFDSCRGYLVISQFPGNCE